MLLSYNMTMQAQFVVVWTSFVSLSFDYSYPPPEQQDILIQILIFILEKMLVNQQS